MSWKNIMNKNNWVFQQVELIESNVCLENPGRGWYGIYTFVVQDSINPEELRWSLRDGELLALVLLDISIYRSMQLDENALNNLSFFMYYKKDVILRPVYDREGKGRECEPDSFEQVLEHLQQIGGLLRDMQHSVFIFQGMLAGSWGEMHDSRYLSPECINRMWNCMRQYLGDEIYLAVRTPAQWRTLRSEKEFRQKKYAHLALFDDGILGSMTHLAGCGGTKKDADKTTEINVGYFNNVTHAQALYMKAQGTLDKAFDGKAKVKWTSFNAGPSEVEALFSGDIDIGYIGPVPAISANVKSKGDVSIISGASQAGAELVKAPGSEIESAKDLDGKTVAIPQIGNTQHLCLLKLLSDNGLKTVEEGGTVTVTAVENADIQNMMDQGNIDAALVPEPWGSTLVKNGAEIVLDYNGVYMEGNYPVAVVVVRNEFLKEHPDLVKEFLKQHEAATDEINQNADEAAKIINDEINAATGKSLSEDILQTAFQKLTISTEVNKDAVDDFAAISLEQKFIDQKPSDDFITEVK